MTAPAAPDARRGTRGRAALLVMLAAVVHFALASATWFSARVPGAVQGDVDVAASGAAAVPVLGGVALVLLAAGGALGLVGPVGRRVVGVLVALAGGTGAVLVAQVLRAPGETLRDAVADATGVGQVPADVTVSPFAWVTVAVGCAVVVLGARHAAGRGTWPTPGSRHDRAAEATSGVAGPAVLEDPARAWDALSDGTDPS